MSTLIDNLNAVRASVADAAAAAGRTPADVTLLAVSKTFPAEDIAEAYSAGGQRAFGENRVQELEEKAPRLPADIQWHLIGHLQRNKVRAALKYAAWIHSVDSPELFRRIEEIAAETGKSPKLLLEVNISGEESKFGFRPEDAVRLLQTLPSELPAPVVGFMTMAPFGATREELQAVFGGLRELRDKCRTLTGMPLNELSMGMSGDFDTAIACGSTMVRVGTAIFGHRTVKLTEEA